MSNILFTSKYCEVVRYPVHREFSQRELEAFTNAGHKAPPKSTRRYQYDDTQFAIIVFNDNGNRVEELVYTGWAFASCACATLSGVTRVNLSAITDKDAYMADFIDAIGACEKASGYPPHRFFMNFPKTREEYAHYYTGSQIERIFKEKGVAITIAYAFDNRAHDSQENRLFDVDTDVLRAWQKDYHAKLAAIPAVPVAVPVASEPIVGDWLDTYGNQAKQATPVL